MLNTLKQLATTAIAVVQGVANTMTGRYNSESVALNPGDPAPDFELQGSDGQRYRLSDVLRGGPVVLAWFPKAFTGG